LSIAGNRSMNRDRHRASTRGGNNDARQRATFCIRGGIMAVTAKSEATSPRTTSDGVAITRERLISLLNEDLAREYQAVIAYTVYSQVLKGAEYMNIADELEKHARQELEHALIIAKQIDYLGGMPTVAPKQVKTSEDPREMLCFDLDNENETIRNYRERVRQCEALGGDGPGRGGAQRHQTRGTSVEGFRVCSGSNS
jgi:bacterioferritin